MRNSVSKRILVMIMTVMLVTSMMPSYAFAATGTQPSEEKQSTNELQVTEESEAASDEQSDSGQNKAEMTAETPSEEASVTTETEEAAADEADAGEPSADVDTTAVSETNNIVGDVFVNAINTADDKEAQTEREESLEEYPLESHNRTYYGLSNRVRKIGDAENGESNYLVYRDSYLIISQKNGEKYEVGFSEDGTCAVISPAIPESKLEGKTGIVFLRENIGEDDVLVFDGDPEYNDDSMTVPIKKAEDITVNELFSDGKLTVSDPSAPKMGLRASSVPIPTWNFSPSGKNWSGTISNGSLDNVSADVEIDIWKLFFELKLGMRFSFDFDITTTGSSGGRNTVTAAGVSIPIKGLLTIGVNYNMQTEFDETPIHVKGRMITDFAFGFGTYPAKIHKYNTSVKITDLDVKGNYNKDINFYIGSQLDIRGDFLSIQVDLKIFKISIGPVLSIAFDCEGGCRFKARHDKDRYTTPDRSWEEIHTCTANGKAGCLELVSTETERRHLSVDLDLFFDSWHWDPYDSGEKTIGTKQYYNSYTFNSGMQEGICPHRLYKVPVLVSKNEQLTDPAPNMNVTVTEYNKIFEYDRQYAQNTTGSDGKTALHLPYLDAHHYYTFTADGEIAGMSAIGSKKQTDPIQTRNNPQVNIIIASEEQITVNTEIIWNTDIDKNEVESRGFMIKLFRRGAGTNNTWEYQNKFCSVGKEGNWHAESFNVPKYHFSGDRAILNEYVTRIDSTGRLVLNDERLPLSVAGYTDASGAPVQQHTRDCYVEYSDDADDTTTLTTIDLTPYVRITLNKRWDITGTKPDSVYLAMLQMPAKGWGQIGNQQRVPNEWLPGKKTFETSSDMSTLKQLIDANVVTSMDDWSSVENIPLTMGRVSDENDWQVSYAVPLYRNGVKMQFKGAELNSNELENFFDREYGITSSLYVKPFGDYKSTESVAAGTGFTDKDDQIAIVINSDPLEEGEILGFVNWQDYHNYSDTIPEYVELTIKKNGVATGETIRLNRSDEKYAGNDTWVWTKKLTDYDPAAEYTVEEKYPEGTKNWMASCVGLNVYNFPIPQSHENDVYCEIQAVFDYEPDEIEEINTNLVEEETGTTIGSYTLEKNPSVYAKPWLKWDRLGVWDSLKSISSYRLDAPDLDGYVKVYDEPFEHKRPNYYGHVYNYTVRYYRQSKNLKIHVKKEWDNNGDDSPDYPDEVLIQVYRDGEMIKEQTITKKPTGQWSDIVIDRDNEGNNLCRVDEETGHKYVYTVEEKAVDGWTSSVVVTQDKPDDIYYTVNNKWVGPDYVNVIGNIEWEGDEGHENLRPESVAIAVLDSDGNRVRTISVPVTDATYEAKYLPAMDSDGNTIKYQVVEDHINGYTTTYSEPVADYDNHEYRININNELTGFFPLKIKKILDGEPEQQETYKFTISSVSSKDDTRGGGRLPSNADKLTVKGEGEVTAEFLLDDPGIFFYKVKEEKGSNEHCRYDDSEKLLILSRTRGFNGQQAVKSWVVDDTTGIDWDDIEGSYKELTSEDEKDVSALKETDTVEFTNRYPKIITVKKTWDIDLEKLDKPDSIEAVVQEKKDGKWKNVALVELNDDNDWQAEASLTNKGDEYRVRELKEETALGSLVKNIRETISSSTGDTYQQIIDKIKNEGASYYNALPESVRKAIDEGEESLKKELDATSEDLYDKLIEQLGLTGADNRIVYDKDDDDKGENTANEVVYSVEEHESVVAGGSEPAHKTKYRVKYSKDKNGDTYTIENKAILEIDVIKRWLALGVKEEDMPKSAWVVLMCKPDPKVLKNAKGMGVDISDVLDYEFPVMYPLEGGVDPLSLFADLALGIDISWIVEVAQDILSIFGIEWIIPTFAIGEVNENNGWTYKVVVSKYTLGIPMEYKGAELSSELIRQIIKYITDGWIDLPVSFNPFDGYLSIPTKAIRTVLGIENWSDIVDGNAWDALKEKGKNLTFDDIKNFGPKSLLDDDKMMANVINIKIDIDPEIPTYTKTLEGSKIWKDDRESDRPDYIKIHIKRNGTEIEDSPLILNKSENRGKSEWSWEYELQKEDFLAYYSVTEEYPENYPAETKKHYSTVFDGLDIINVWSDDIQDKVTISGSKVWLDYSNMDNMRPETITVYLKANGERVKNSKGEEAKAITSKAGGWKYSFPYQPKFDAQGNEIVYSVEEEPVDGYTTKYAGYNIINSRIPETISASGVVVWQDKSNQDGIRPESVTVKLLANGEEKQSCNVSAADGWKWKFTNLPVSDNNGDIEYTVAEAETDVITGTDGEGTYSYKVEGTAAAGFVITNKHTPSTVSISGSKIWDDDNDRDGRRPDLITINLLADGEKVDSKTVTAADGWSWNFADMPEYKAGSKISYTISEDNVSGYSSTVNGYDVTNKYVPEMTSIRVRKAWAGESGNRSNRPDTITFNLLADGNEVASKSVDVSDDSNAAEYNFDGLWPVYRDHGTRINYTITEDPVIDYTTQVTGTSVVNTYAPQKTQVSVHKVWDDNDDQDGIRPQSVTVKLLKNGEDSGKTLILSEAGSWNAVFTDLNKNEHGSPVSYSVAEIRTDVITGTDAAGTYESKVSGDAESGFIITNKHTPIKRGISVKKVWDDDDNADGQRPSRITLRLRANGNEVDSKSVTEQDGWKCTFENVDVYKGGRRINYAVTEDAVENYTTSVSGDAETGFTVSNKHNPGKTQVQVFKLWLDADNQDGKRPETITVHLLADGEDTRKTLILSEDNNWMGSFDDINRKKNGRDISYSVTEDPVPGYRMSLWGNAESGYVIFNLTELQTKTINVRKVWDDNNNQDGKRPGLIVVRLMANGREVTARELTEDNGWKESFEGVDVNSGGKKITYSISEDTVEGYTTAITGNDDFGYTVTNSYTPQETQVKVQKIWTDNDNQDGMRPASVVVRLFADGTDSGKTVELSEANQWQSSFDGLAKMKDGKDIRYTVTEDAVGGYQSEIRGSAENGYQIYNFHDPASRSIDVSKVWDDNDDQDGARPEKIVYRLMADGVEVDSKSVTGQDGWKWTFSNLPVFKAGKQISYTVSEDKIEGYTSNISGNMTDGFTVTNTHAPDKTQVKVSKRWSDDNNRDHIRPDGVTVRLLADGEDSGREIRLTEANGWAGTFDGLDLNSRGKKIIYTVEEEKTSVITGKDGPGTYRNAVTGDADAGFTIVNIHTPETISLSGSKTWNDDNNQDSKRPESITVRLWTNEGGIPTVVDAKTVTSADEWKWTFDDLPKYSDGKEIRYTLSEDYIEGYTSEINGMNITNSYTPEETQVTVYKWWLDDEDRDGKRPKNTIITVYKVNADGTKKSTGKTLTLNDDNGWIGTVSGLDKYEKVGEESIEIEYAIEETLPDGYIRWWEWDGTGEFKNTHIIVDYHEPETVKITGTKVWNDNNNQDGMRPDKVRIYLYANGELRDFEIEAKAENNWEWTNVRDCYKYYDKGKLVEYTVEEEPVEGYSSKVTKNGYDFTLTNTHDSETITLSGKKTWDDEDNNDGVRPLFITVRLKADGREVDSKIVTALNSWKWEFKDVPKNSSGREIIYTVTEDVVKDYTSAISGMDVTNKHTPDKTQVYVNKVWDDADDQDGIRPDSVTVKLLADGEDTGMTLDLNEDNEWSGSFDDLNAKAAGKDIEYTVEEVKTSVVTGKDSAKTYAVAISGDAKKGYTITNTHTPWYTITYKLNGGKYNGSTADIVKHYQAGTKISIHEAPARKGYKFLYWKGSEYHPGDKYTVTEDHVFTAQWKKNAKPGDPDKPDKPDKPDTPSAKTGDENDPVLWMLMLLGSLLGLAEAVIIRKRKTRIK